MVYEKIYDVTEWQNIIDPTVNVKLIKKTEIENGFIFQLIFFKRRHTNQSHYNTFQRKFQMLKMP